MSPMHDQIHRAIRQNESELNTWFEARVKNLSLPLYSSYDIRDSSFKVAPVDANLFPAGFNNICLADKESSVELVERYFKSHYSGVKKVALLTEEHTKNLYYLDNVHTISEMLKEAGLEVSIIFPNPLEETLSLTSASGHRIQVEPYEKREGCLYIQGEKVCLIIANNDFSVAAPDFVKDLKAPINPPYELGWHRRKKFQFFENYNRIASEVAELLDLPAPVFQVATEVFEGFDIGDPESREKLSQRVDQMIHRLKEDYKKLGWGHEPYLFLKNSSGTYGLGVTSVHSGQEVLEWSYKDRKKMKAAKGGGGIESLILQEGIPTSFEAEGGGSAEPAIYMIGCQLAGGFLRTHGKKSAEESLNSPGAVYKRLCLSDLKIDSSKSPLENVYGCVSRLALLAVAEEVESEGIRFGGAPGVSCP